jgi:hypothetical protein
LWEICRGSFYDRVGLEKTHPELAKLLQEAYLIVLADSGLYPSPPGEDRNIISVCDHVTQIQVSTKLTHGHYTNEAQGFIAMEKL